MFSWFLKKKENDGQPFAVPVLMGKGQTAAEVHSPVKGTVRILLIPKRIRSFRIKLRAEDPVFSLEYPLTYPRRALFDDLNTPGGRLRVFLEKFLASARDTEITLPETIFIGVSGMSLFVKRTGIPDGGLAVRDMCREGRLTAEFTLAGSKARLFASQSGVIIYDRESVKADSARLLRSYLRWLAGRLLPAYVLSDAFPEELRDRLKGVSVTDAGTRLGSLSKKNGSAGYRMHLSWRTILLPRKLLRHLVCHEFTHSLAMNHQQEFYANLARLSPDWEILEKELDRAWLALPLWCRGKTPPAKKISKRA